ncbi:MAG TPA: hypothetical protein VLL75_14360 [Vicinamibacteria bacterium]|nr:hypothetical protein [Vicinamibacteria bacterium]
MRLDPAGPARHTPGGGAPTRRRSRFLPIVVGLLLGCLLVSPPAWVASLGPWRWPAVAALVLLVLLAFTAYQLSANLPAEPPLEPAAEAELGDR